MSATAKPTCPICEGRKVVDLSAGYGAALCEACEGTGEEGGKAWSPEREIAQLRAALAEQHRQHEVEAKALAAQGEDLRQELVAALAKVAEQAAELVKAKAEATAQANARLAAERRGDDLAQKVTRLQAPVRFGTTDLKPFAPGGPLMCAQLCVYPEDQAMRPLVLNVALDSATIQRIKDPATRWEGLCVASAEPRRLPAPEDMHGAADGQGGSDFPSFEHCGACGYLGPASLSHDCPGPRPLIGGWRPPR